MRRFDFQIGIEGGGGLVEKISLSISLRYMYWLLVSLSVLLNAKLILCSETVKNLYNLEILSTSNDYQCVKSSVSVT